MFFISVLCGCFAIYATFEFRNLFISIMSCSSLVIRLVMSYENVADMVFFQNGMMEPWLESKCLNDANQVLAYFAVSKLGEAPIDGKTDTNPEGLTAAYGKWASAVAERLHAGGLSCKVSIVCGRIYFWYLFFWRLTCFQYDVFSVFGFCFNYYSFLGFPYSLKFHKIKMIVFPAQLLKGDIIIHLIICHLLICVKKARFLTRKHFKSRC